MRSYRIKQKGFTLAELLIVIAIIGVLVAIAIPIFTSQLEKSRQAVDLHNARSAYGAARIKWMTEDAGKEVTYYFNGSDVVTSSAGITGYGKSEKNAEDFSGAIPCPVTGFPKKDGTANYITVNVDKDGNPTIKWGSGFSFAAITGGSSGHDNFAWGENQFVKDAKKTLLDTDNQKRLTQDQEVLKELSNYFSSVSSSELENILGKWRYPKVLKGESTVLFEYQVNKDGVVDVVNIDSPYQPYFSDIGYDAQFAKSTYGPAINESNFIDDETLQTGSTSYNYANKYLFTSNEMIGDMANGVKRQVWIQYKTDANGNKVASLWVKDLQDQLNSSN